MANDSECTIQGCAKAEKARGWCSMHYERWRKWGDPNSHPKSIRGVCSLDDCDRPHQAKGFCKTHWQSSLICSFDDCDEPVRGHGWCRRHYNRWRYRAVTKPPIDRTPFDLEPIDAAWLAGLFEGEGCIHTRDGRYVRLAIQMTDADVLGRVAAMTTKKGLRTSKHETAGGKTLYAWDIGWRPDVVELLETMLPWFGERRRARALEALECLQGQVKPIQHRSTGEVRHR